MKVFIFKTHFEKFKNHLLLFKKIIKQISFLLNLNRNLKTNFLNIDNVFKLKEKILIMIII